MQHNISFQLSKNSLRVPVNIYGSGISGLITAYNFLKLGFLDINIITKGRGVIQSLETPDGVVEFAANSILQNDEVTNLLKELEIEYEYYSSLGKKKFIFHENKPSKWPLNFLETIKSLYPLLKLASKSKKALPKKLETVEDWGDRVVGEIISKRLIQKALQGVYGPTTKDLSASLCLAGLFEKKKPSKGSISFKNGMGSFIKTLENEVSMRGVKFTKIKDGNTLEEKEGITIICTPAHSVPDFVKNDFSRVEYQRISTVTFIFDEENRLPFKGFGCLFDSEGKGILGVILNSDLFDNRAPKGKVSETWILEGDKYSSESDLNELLRFREEEFKVDSKPLAKYFKYWEKAFPVYNLDLEETLDELTQEKKIYFFANWTGKIGIGKLIEESPKFIRSVMRDMSTNKNQ